MNNKKLLKFILKDLEELEELVAERTSDNLDELEWEFMQTRVSGAKRMIKILFDRESLNSTGVNQETETESLKISEEKIEELVVKEPLVVKIEEHRIIDVVEEQKEEIDEVAYSPEQSVELEEKSESLDEKRIEVAAQETEPGVETNLQLDEEDAVVESQQTLGDRFHKEKSVNDLLDSSKTNLEQKLSNRAVSSIKTSIGINDRFQYVRELFDGNSDTYLNAVSELDRMNTINEAVTYLQQNFKWKKNETSLKFVNLVKRRFINE